MEFGSDPTKAPVVYALTDYERQVLDQKYEELISFLENCSYSNVNKKPGERFFKEYEVQLSTKEKK